MCGVEGSVTVSAESLEPAYPDVFHGAVAGSIVDDKGLGHAAPSAAGRHVVQLPAVGVPAAEAAPQARRLHGAGVALYAGRQGHHVTHAQQRHHQQRGKGGQAWALKRRVVT